MPITHHTTTRPTLKSKLLARRRHNHTAPKRTHKPATTTTTTTRTTRTTRTTGAHRHTAGTTAAPVHHHKRRVSMGDKVAGMMMKLKGSVMGRRGVKAAGTRRMRGTDGRNARRVY
ncbi:predicted protein [Plenodomus lingam JN3]|uniref:Predicted protein n=1 Tax=Leptosphaeria maculans (strain JN3 / isolate v23.1.3 / race Av1-4-5-6-7-8) TaxID=985895 RepID=E5R4X2_LEPMJ|nr:predicted protein [Plenodomus lingam JN3]CBX92245.1 predicted protein [Plenodomus lingam JN3]